MNGNLMAVQKFKKMGHLTVEWLCATPANRLQDLKNSNIASVRLRTAVGIQAGNSIGLRNLISDGQRSESAQLIVVGKIDYASDPERPNRWLHRIRELKSKGALLLIDYTDHHLSSLTPSADFYQEALPSADLVITSSEKLRKNLAGHIGLQSLKIEDPIEVPIQPPFERNNSIKTILWFGHASNLKYLIEYLSSSYDSNIKKRLIVMTNLHPLPENYVQALSEPHLNSLEINVIPWSVEDLITAAGISDICIIPAGVLDPRKSGASSNRLLTALALGLPTVADNLDSYGEFSDYFVDLRKVNIDKLLDDVKSMFPKIIGAQQSILNKYTIESARDQWVQLLTRMLPTQEMNKK